MASLTLKTVTVVAVGSFDIASFSPTALLSKEIISVADAVAADKIALFPGKLSSFQIDGRMQLSAEHNRVAIEASAPPYVRIADVLSKALRDNQTYPSKITALGINVHGYFAVDNFEARDRLGHKLAPLEVWGKWSGELQRGATYPPSDRRHAGMLSIVMRLPSVEDRLNGWLDVRVEPSVRTKDTAEIFIAVNDHYDLGTNTDGKDKIEDPLFLLEVPEARFDASVQRADDIMSAILEQAR